MFTGRMGRISIFCSYAREDEAIRSTLERYLRPLREERIIDDWYDSRIEAGARWDDEIQQALDRSRMMIFIVTPDLLSSRYVAEVEIPKGLERERAGECRIVPVTARRADWRDSPLSRFQALPGGGHWLDTEGGSDAAYLQVASGIRQVCRSIVDWENPYKRSGVGDWTYQEQTISMADGRSATGDGTEEMVARTETEATLLLEIRMNGEVRRQTIQVDLTQPLEDRLGDVMRQAGSALPANLEMSTGPAAYGEEHVSIGGRRYETVRARRDLTLGMRGLREAGHATQWRCIDVPLFGLVKGEAELPGWRQYQVLLDYGHGDAGARKPRLTGQGSNGPTPASPYPPDAPLPHPASGAPISGPAAGFTNPPAGGTPAPWAPPQAPPPVGPGRWSGQLEAYGTRTMFDLILHPDGGLQGRQNTMGMLSDLHGRWMFDAGSSTLTFQVITSIMGVPNSNDLVQVRITGSHGATLIGHDQIGRHFVMRRAG